MLQNYLHEDNFEQIFLEIIAPLECISIYFFDLAACSAEIPALPLATGGFAAGLGAGWGFVGFIGFVGFVGWFVSPWNHKIDLATFSLHKIFFRAFIC